MNRVRATYLEWFVNRQGWLYYEGCRDPWRPIHSIEVLPIGRYKVTFPNGQWRTFDLGEPIYVESNQTVEG